VRDSIRLYFRYVGISVRSQLQYRATVVMNAFGQFLITGIEFLVMWSLFDRFGQIRGWTLPEVALLYGMANVSFALAEAIARGFDVFSQAVRSGDFDRMLLRPRSTALQVAAGQLEIMRVGRLSQGLAVVIWAASALGVVWTVPRALLLLAGIVSGAMTFGALFVVQATICFWSTQGLEIMNTTTYGGVETAQYPLAIYDRWFRRFFTFVVPLAFLNYYPSLGITGRPDPLGAPAVLSWLAPLAGPVFLAVAFRFWSFGVRRYRSTGS
jgi:ABC-2 type transport system permease protein